eukprot:ANDGO_00800.mRNA.1 Protein tilB
MQNLDASRSRPLSHVLWHRIKVTCKDAGFDPAALKSELEQTQFTSNGGDWRTETGGRLPVPLDVSMTMSRNGDEVGPPAVHPMDRFESGELPAANDNRIHVDWKWSSEADALRSLVAAVVGYRRMNLLQPSAATSLAMRALPAAHMPTLNASVKKTQQTMTAGAKTKTAVAELERSGKLPAMGKERSRFLATLPVSQLLDPHMLPCVRFDCTFLTNWFLSVDLSDSKITEIDGLLEEFGRIKEFKAINNDISVLQHLPPALEELSMSGNRIHTVASLPQGGALVYLNLAFNHLTDAAWLCTAPLPKLVSLDLRCNALSDLASTIRYISLNCPSLKLLFLVGNPFFHHPDYRKFVIGSLPDLFALDDVEVADEERDPPGFEVLFREDTCAKLAFKVDIASLQGLELISPSSETRNFQLSIRCSASPTSPVVRVPFSASSSMLLSSPIGSASAVVEADAAAALAWRRNHLVVLHLLIQDGETWTHVGSFDVDVSRILDGMESVVRAEKVVCNVNPSWVSRMRAAGVQCPKNSCLLDATVSVSLAPADTSGS